MMVQSKPRDVQVSVLTAETTLVRSRSWNRLRFEVEYARERGTTANSFVIAADHLAVLDPPGESFTEIYLQALRERLDFSQLRYIILGHINPNRAETLKVMLAQAPNATVVCSNPAAIALQELLPDQTVALMVIRGEETLDLGQGHVLQFTLAPTPRWPGGLFTYDPKSRILFTDKFFGAHVCGHQVQDEGWTVYNGDRRYYYDCLMAPSARQVTTILERIAPLDVQMYAPGHGPLVRYGRQDLTQNYQSWSQQQRTQETQVTLLYASAYGNTATLAQAIARGITKAGVGVESINCEMADPEDIKRAIESSAGFIIGSPTLGGHAPTPIQTALGIILSTATPTQLAGVFGSFGWSGEAIDFLENKLRDGGYQFGFETIRVKFKPTDVTIKFCEEAGTDFAQALKKARKVKAPKAAASSVEQAVGRLVGSLCVATVRHGDVTSAMLASWVSQATFDPPGLTVAIAQDRAIESLLYPDQSFVLNILAEGRHLGLMKQFLKPFGPGDDRFTGVETEEADNGSPILKEALAYVECRVKQQMDCGDHALIYAVIERGQVLDGQGKTAVHYRTTGTHY